MCPNHTFTSKKIWVCVLGIHPKPMSKKKKPKKNLVWVITQILWPSTKKNKKFGFPKLPEPKNPTFFGFWVYTQTPIFLGVNVWSLPTFKNQVRKRNPLNRLITTWGPKITPFKVYLLFEHYKRTKV